MKQNRLHHNHQLIRLFKNTFAILAFIPPIFISILLFKDFTNPAFSIDSLLSLVFLIIISPVCILLAAYFYTDLEVDENGLMVEFLWKKLRISWSKVLQIKPLFGIKTRKPGIYVVIVEGLTPFHLLYGLIYGFSLRPAFILWSTVNDFGVLKNDIEKHIKRNRKTTP